jgi:Family of unknown function (DUF6088)
MNIQPTITQAIKTHLETLPLGQPFTPKSLLHLGSRAAIDQVLSRLTREGRLHRAARGVYCRPIIAMRSRQALPVQLPLVLEVIAYSQGQTIAPHGAVALNYFEFSTQNPLQAVFLTSGRSRTLEVEGQAVQLKHVSANRLPLGNSKAGLAVTAMRYLGANRLTLEHVQRIRGKLEAKDWSQLEAILPSQPAWLISTVLASTPSNARLGRSSASSNSGSRAGARRG